MDIYHHCVEISPKGGSPAQGQGGQQHMQPVGNFILSHGFRPKKKSNQTFNNGMKSKQTKLNPPPPIYGLLDRLNTCILISSLSYRLHWCKIINN